ncbi:DAD/Ost2 [Carpediemonas membranifera]|uniref:Dolichyl-diphosphooligosaccharide--protein glycosyltransferase subunit OST2 n=1 Tax=Carpediemonas membranifera TaxID=201153 RepID=A0A8J6E0L9_9EUKA|nr:DAD/Ost2 [Carpediemonas membranifera]|eukprot:KAG9389512.1 DAD/Ost2 [Carpediemonas membranifera]
MGIIKELVVDYGHTSAYLKGIDCFIAACMLNLCILFGYVFLVGKYPYYSFLAAVFASVGMATLLINLRLQSAAHMDKGIPRKPFLEFVFAAVVLIGVCFHYLG